ncbi:chromosome segregation protein SMC [Buchananella hordeovulneris]|uniref:chromosome segregation SMC family protein n=1 Tax=Buchananella hordeovulneris TaxID=52770 RepID=UPI000F5DFF70|nr:AAA family ATPase [Buchananella hordeovulneris]RRD53437.1 chromosome segregation protein SMC [Buchananella hordeovulneris]
MHLRTLTLRGFKSFASATTLTLEPGITCVVGPNGSGKSNVVDALAWVMGEQGAKTLRGGSMADVIFAGTAGRSPLGRAEVELTIDNSDGALPIDYSEVTIARTLFRGGASEYRLNGAPCRLLDIQELLSDTGMGRQMHVIVGQGQLDAVLRASPEERRAFIEEAAGVLKHRRRKERALRKLESMASNMARVRDLTGEIRRQLGPLARQARAARLAATVQARVRDAKSRLLADDLVQLGALVESVTGELEQLRGRRAELEELRGGVKGQLTQAEAAAHASAPALRAADELVATLAQQRERLVGLGQLAGERARTLAAPVGAAPGTDPEELEARAAQAAQEEAALAAELDAARAALTQAEQARAVASDADTAARHAQAEAARQRADHREHLARLTGAAGAAASRLEAAEGEHARLTGAVSEAAARLAAAQAEIAAAGDGTLAADSSFAAAREQALTVLADAEATARQAASAVAATRADKARWDSRRDALALTLDPQDSTGTVAAASAAYRGRFAEFVAIAAGWEDAVAGALGAVADAAVLTSLAAAVDAVRAAQADDAAARLVVAEPEAGGDPDAAADAAGGARTAGGTDGGTEAAGPEGAQGRGTGGTWGGAVAGPDGASAEGAANAGAQAGPTELPALPAGVSPNEACWALAAVRPAPAVAGLVGELLADTLLVADLATARDLVAAGQVRRAVTRRGDVVGVRFVHGQGAQAGSSALARQAAYTEAGREAELAATRASEALAAQTAANQALEAARAAAEEALRALRAHDAALAAQAEAAAKRGAAAKSAQAEQERAEAAAARSAAQLTSLRQAATAARELLAEAEAHPPVTDDDTDAHREHTRAALAAAHQAETEARLALRTLEERVGHSSGRADALRAAARKERAAREETRRREQLRLARLSVAQDVAEQAGLAAAAAETSLQLAQARRAEVEAATAGTGAEIERLRRDLEAVNEELAVVTDAVHRDEIVLAEHALRHEQLVGRAHDELSVTPEVLIEEYGPHTLVPLLADEGAEEQKGQPYVRSEVEAMLTKAEKQLARLGTVNPLALEEHAALEERHTFLTEQLADLERSQADLMRIISEVDATVQTIFAEAFADTAAAFDQVFPRLFPGGKGKLFLTDPDDILTTGVEIEARPAGKRVGRLSLLSGGERSLAAVALLVSIFMARPSPFYVMDEVEAALDDANLGRLLDIFGQLRERSQLIVVTHQKRTMEIADALYGVTMKEGVTQVVSQRLAARPAPAAPGE